MTNNYRNNLGEVIKQQRVTVSLTLQELAARSGVSSSHLGRIERGERFPSALVLRNIAKPLGFDEGKPFTLKLEGWGVNLKYDHEVIVGIGILPPESFPEYAKPDTRLSKLFQLIGVR